MSKKLITDPADLQAELERLKAENAQLQENKGGVFVGDAPLIGGMSEPANKIVKVIHQQDQKGEKIASTTRCDMGYDPTQRFNGRQP